MQPLLRQLCSSTPSTDVPGFTAALQGLVAGPPHVRGAALQALDHSPAINDGTGGCCCRQGAHPAGGKGGWLGPALRCVLPRLANSAPSHQIKSRCHRSSAPPHRSARR